MVNHARSIKGVECGVLVTPAKRGGTRVSMRSKGHLVDAGQVCLALGGGGHRGAAGCTLAETDIAVARKTVEEALAAPSPGRPPPRGRDRVQVVPAFLNRARRESVERFWVCSVDSEPARILLWRLCAALAVKSSVMRRLLLIASRRASVRRARGGAPPDCVPRRERRSCRAGGGDPDDAGRHRAVQRPRTRCWRPGWSEYTVSWELWADGATSGASCACPKARRSTARTWISGLSGRDQMWKEFSVDGTRVETRLIWKRGRQLGRLVRRRVRAGTPRGPRRWRCRSVRTHALGRATTSRAANDCRRCHERQPDFVLGFSRHPARSREGAMNLGALVDAGALSNRRPARRPTFALPGNPTRTRRARLPARQLRRLPPPGSDDPGADPAPAAARWSARSARWSETPAYADRGSASRRPSRSADPSPPSSSRTIAPPARCGPHGAARQHERDAAARQRGHRRGRRERSALDRDLCRSACWIDDL
jgi:hypothetical protein